MPNHLTHSYQEISNRIIRATGSMARKRFVELGSWREEDIDRYLKAIETPMAGAKKLAANLQLAYYRESATTAGQKFSAPRIKTASLATASLRNGADTRTVHSRPFVELWTALSLGKTMTESIKAGAIRSESLASTEIELVRRQVGSTARNRNSNIVGYRRVLSGMEDCGICIVASTQEYHRGDLMPIHPGCDCGEEPIYGEFEPEEDFEEENQESLDEEMAQRFDSFEPGDDPTDFKKAIIIHQHGELGPILGIRGQKFTTAADLGIS